MSGTESIVDKVQKLEDAAVLQGSALALPKTFYSMNDFLQLRMLSDAYTVLIERYEPSKYITTWTHI